ncbi:hypothetical protein HC752_11710 [Vibrio sp. S9_S30]|uniref:hypothetical protein n=1 Tax=Vibrio sp. S9_S30 TaxID=2720226 RepID=UPI001680FA4A|nr:hypothetical protein [Vibrio sp. S9_S30]MBD1557597.1 hypothetical protein [Vibrio sp. S9_S30]
MRCPNLLYVFSEQFRQIAMGVWQQEYRRKWAPRRGSDRVFPIGRGIKTKQYSITLAIDRDDQSESIPFLVTTTSRINGLPLCSPQQE